MFKKKLLLALLTLVMCGSNAQLLQTRSAIIKELGYLGYGYKTGISDDGINYIYYDKEMNTIASGKYIQRKIMYFTKLDDGSEVCYLWKIIEPSSETNTNVANYRKKFVQIGHMQWKDYEINVMYEIIVKDGYCLILAWYDDET